MSVATGGTAFTGFVSLTNGAPGPTAFTIRTAPGGPAYTLQAGERLHITGVSISSNDTAATPPLAQVDLGAATYVVISAYVGATIPAYVDNITPGIIGIAAVVPRASAATITATKTIECKIVGFVSRQ